MAAITLTQKERDAFESMFLDLASAKAEGRREDAARIAFAITEPMVAAQKALNRFKRRVAIALESGNTSYGLAAVQAFKNEMLECALRDGQARTVRSRKQDLLMRAADIASKNALSGELDAKPSYFEANRMLRGLEKWLDEKLDEMDALTPEADEDTETPSAAVP